MPVRRPFVKSADRVLDLLEVLADAASPMAHADLARASGIPKSSLTHLLRNLHARGYVELEPGSRGYCLGEAARALASRGLKARALAQKAQPFLKSLTAETGESSALSVRRGDVVERICSVDTPRAELYAMHIGVLAPLHALSAGKVLLAALPPRERERYFARQQLPRAALVHLRRELRAVKTEGIAYSLGSFTRGIVGISVPVMDREGQVAAALSTALPQSRLDAARREALVRALRGHAAKLRLALGAELTPVRSRT